MSRDRAPRAGWLLIALGLTCACSSSARSAAHDAGAGPGKDAGGATPSGGVAGSNAFGNAPPGTAAEIPDASALAAAAADCAGTTQQAQRVDVDMYVMLDRSDSMLDVTGAGPTKWDAIREALTKFVSDPQSDGLGVGLQYFPLGKAGVPEHCSTDSDCGSNGPCNDKACVPPNPYVQFPFIQCLTTADCPAAAAGCAPFGVCELDKTQACLNLGPGGCQQLGACQPVQGECESYASCDSADYEAPAVPIDVLPGNANALTSSLQSEMPTGLTPTPAALTGAINRAALHAQQNPTHRVVTVLATDGLPTECVPANVQTVAQAVTAVADIAAQGLALQPSIETYVIGVFAPTDTGAMANLDMMAAAGGTGHAFIVDTSQDVAQQLLDALATIRGGTLACQFQLPEAPTGTMLDFNQVNVELMQDSGNSMLLYARSPDQCGQTDLGWYYDVDPASGGTPTKILVCPHTCDMLQAAHNASVEVKLGCATRLL